MNSVIIVGAGGHGKVVADIIKAFGDEVFGYLDDDTTLGDTFNDYPILGIGDDFNKFKDHSFIIAIGNPKTRERVAGEMEGVSWYTAIHPSAVISDSARIGEGSVVMPLAVINADARLGKHCIVNSGAIVEHDNVLEDYVHMAVGAKAAGTVHIGARTWVGIGAVIINNVNICADCMIGAGAVVIRNVEEAGTYVGVPSHMK